MMGRLKLRIRNKVRGWRGLPPVKADGTLLSPSDITYAALRALHEKGELPPKESSDRFTMAHLRAGRGET